MNNNNDKYSNVSADMQQQKGAPQDNSSKSVAIHYDNVPKSNNQEVQYDNVPKLIDQYDNIPK
jgi:hypothetical protein